MRDDRSRFSHCPVGFLFAIEMKKLNALRTCLRCLAFGVSVHQSADKTIAVVTGIASNGKRMAIQMQSIG